MGILGKKKKKETAEELKAKLEELEGKPEEEPEAIPEPPKKAKEPIEEPEGKFSLDENEMTLAVNALAERPELKVYNDFVIGQKIAEIIAAYNKVVGEKSEATEDTEEKLPTG